MSTVSGTSSVGGGNSVANPHAYDLKPADFIKMMVTQLQNQDPMEPAKNTELLSQMSQIGQLQSSTDLQTSLKSMVMQNQIASAGNLIGKMVKGTNATGDDVDGLVNSVRVSNDSVTLELDNGKELALDKVTHITDGTGATSTIGAKADVIDPTAVTQPKAA